MKRIIEDYEARLHPPSDGSGSGKAEWERYGNDDVQLSVRFRKADVPEGARIEVHLDGATIGNVVVKNGSGRLEIASAAGAVVPQGVDRQRIEVLYSGRLVLSGTFAPD